MLKISDLGNVYNCKCTADNVTAVDVIEDIAAQAGLSSELGDSVDVYSESQTIPCVKAYYDDNGDFADDSQEYVGISKNSLISLPANISDINIEYHGFKTLDEPLRLCYYSDKNGKNLIGVKEYTSQGLNSIFEIELGDDTYYLTPAETLKSDLPKSSSYLGLCFKGNADDGAYIVINYRYKNEYRLVNRNYKIPNPGAVDISPRSMLGYMAAILGGNAKIDRDGVLTVKIYKESSVIIPPEQQYMEGCQKSRETPLTIQYITTGSEADANGQGGVITAGSGSYGFNFANPYITEESAAANILSLYENLSIMPGSVKYRGNPSVDSGDIVTVEDVKGNQYKTIVLSQSISVTGGMSSTINCGLTTNVSSDFVSTPSTRTVTAKLNSFVKKYQDIISSLTGVKGGYVKFVYDTANKLRAIAIPDADVELKWSDDVGNVVSATGDTNVKMWVWSNGGLSYTNDGGRTYEVAMTKEGQIYAEQLVGKLGKVVELEAEKGTIAGWNISETQLYKEFGNYRTSLSSAVGSNYPVICIDEKQSDGNYKENFIVTAKGEVICSNNLSVNGIFWLNQYMYDGNGVEVMNTNSNNALVIGYGQYHRKYNTYYEGGLINLRSAYGTEIQIDTSTIFEINNNWKINGVSMPTIHSHSDFLLSAPDGKAIFLNASGGIYLENDIKTNGDLYLTLQSLQGISPIGVNSNGMIVPVTSSERYKENITDKIDDDINPRKLYSLPIKQYNYKVDCKDIEVVADTQVGITAEDIEKYYPIALIRNKEGKAETWQDRIMIPAMLKLIQEQKATIDNLEKRVEALEKRQN